MKERDAKEIAFNLALLFTCLQEVFTSLNTYHQPTNGSTLRPFHATSWGLWHSWYQNICCDIERKISQKNKRKLYSSWSYVCLLCTMSSETICHPLLSLFLGKRISLSYFWSLPHQSQVTDFAQKILDSVILGLRRNSQSAASFFAKKFRYLSLLAIYGKVWVLLHRYRKVPCCWQKS